MPFRLQYAIREGSGVVNWMTCSHNFVRYFGPVLHCSKCGASTMVTMDPKESKPIYPPSATTDVGAKVVR